jgi:hypothetical protein
MERHPVIAETPAICTFPLSVKGIDKWILCMVFVIICVVVYVILQACLYVISKRANFRLRIPIKQPSVGRSEWTHIR